MCVWYRGSILDTENTHGFFIQIYAPIITESVRNMRQFNTMLTILNLIVLQNIYKAWLINLEPNIDRETKVYSHTHKGESNCFKFFQQSPGNPRELTTRVLNCME